MLRGRGGTQACIIAATRLTFNLSTKNWSLEQVLHPARRAWTLRGRSFTLCSLNPRRRERLRQEKKDPGTEGFITARATKIAVRPLDNAELERGADRLRTLIYPDHPEAYDVGWHASVWRWLGTHPLAEELHRWVLASEEGEVVGHLAAVPLFYRVGGERVVAHTPADYQVLPGHGFHALSLMRHFFRTVENCVSVDQVPEAIAVEMRFGAKEAGKLQYAAKILDVSQLPRVPAALRPVLGVPNLALRAVDGALGKRLRCRSQLPEVLDGFDASFDELFESVAASVPCVPEKDAAFLRWRYGPASPQYPVTVIGVREGGALLGYAVLRVTRRATTATSSTSRCDRGATTWPGRS